jgi:hypothetical protein
MLRPYSSRPQMWISIQPLTNTAASWYNTIGAAEYLSWLEDPAHTRGVVSSILTSATICHTKGDST